MLGDMGMWTKHVNYELSNRIPLIIAAPGIGQAGSHTGQLAETVDIYPTLAELAGLSAPQVPQPFDGLSMVPVLKNPEARRSEEHTSELQSLMRISYAVFCLQKKKYTHTH